MSDKQTPVKNPDDDARIIVEAHLLIRDKETGKILVDKRG